MSRRRRARGLDLGMVAGRAVRKKTRRLRRAAISVVILASLIVGGASLARSSLFAVDGIEIVGMKMLHRQDVLNASGLHLGMNVLSIDTASVRARIEKMPLVASVVVNRIYPSKIKIVITERRAVAVAVVHEAHWLVDARGNMIVQVDSAPLGLPVVKVSAPPGSIALQQALELWGSLPGWAKGKINQLAAQDPLLISARLGGTIVIFGSSDDVEAKMEAVVAIFERAKTDHRRVARIDVRAPTRPAAVFV
ncbi:MAG: cell division protein FtsQ/DivIB [Actinomycetota bacterium]